MRRKKLLTILVLLISITSFAAPKPKYKSIWLSTCVRYDGYQVKKIPEGEGRLVVYNYKDVNCKDVISGSFADNVVTDATVIFAGGYKYDGNLSYKLLPDAIEYTLTDGKIHLFCKTLADGSRSIVPDASSSKISDNDMLEDILKELPGIEVSSDGTITASDPTISAIIIDGKTYSVTCGDDISYEITPNMRPVTIVRKYVDFTTTHSSIQIPFTTELISEESKLRIKDFNAFVDSDYKFKESYDLMIKIDRDVFSTDLGPCKLFISDERYIEHDGRGTFHLVGAPVRISASYNNSNWGELYYEADEVVRVMDGGVITWTSELNGNGWGSYLSSDKYRKINNLYDSPDPKVKPGMKTTKSLKVKYDNGSVYVGTLYSKTKDSKQSDSYDGISSIINILAEYESIPEKEQYSFGVLISPDNSQAVFLGGYTWEEVLQYADARKKEDQEYRESLRIEREKAKIAEERAKKEEERKKQQEIQKLRDKYGAKYVDAIYDSDGRTILVGTPFELVKKIYMVELDADYGDVKGYNWYGYNFLHSKVRAGYITVTKGKVSSVIYKNR